MAMRISALIIVVIIIIIIIIIIMSKKKFVNNSETMEGFSFVTTVTDSHRPNVR
jgi:succinate dehydrogenase hydrophobic anchor subunit